MSDYLMTSRREVIRCLIIDDWQTKMSEDGFCFSGNIDNFRLDVVAVVPPFNGLSFDQLRETLRNQARLQEKKVEQRISFWKEKGVIYGLQEAEQPVLVSTYVATNDQGLVLEEVSLGRAVAQSFTHQELQAVSVEDELRMLERVMRLTTGLSEDAFEKYKRHTKNARGKSNALVQGLLYIFNNSCRNAAKKVGASFIRTIHGKVILNHPHAVFNKSFRDAPSLINMVNLLSHLEGTPVPAAYNIPRLLS